MKLRILAQHCKRFIPLLSAPAALLLSQGQAKAFLTFNIFESSSNVVVQTGGSLNIPANIGTAQCGANGAIISSAAVICTGPNITVDYHRISGPSSFNGTVSSVGSTSVSGLAVGFNGGGNLLLLDSSYTSGSAISSSATFNNTTLAGMGFTISSGLIGTWTLDGTSEKIYACLGTGSCAPAEAAVPGPLPLLGAGAAFGWSRRLRKRIATPSITPPQA